MLVLDTATAAVTAALARILPDGVDIVAQRITVDARAHGELLTPSVQAVLAEGGVRPADRSAVVVGLGPGPFTGLRVGLVTAAALTDALGIPGYGVCSLDGLGTVAGPGRILVATDARRREVYWAVYADGVRVAGPAVAAPAAVPVAGLAAALGEGALRYADVLPVPVRDAPRYPQPAALAALAAHRVRTGAPGEALTPLYLRRPDAVEPGARKAVLG